MTPAEPSPTIATPLRRLPFYYGWVVVAVAFVTMAIGVNVRTAFSLLFSPILDEFGWARGTTAAAFSLGFVVATLYAPFIGVLMDRLGPRYVLPLGAVLVSSGLIGATFATEPWHLHLTLGVFGIGGGIALTYIGHGAFLPHWFVARRGLAIGIAFSGVGVGSILLFPWLKQVIDQDGWRQACWTMGLLLVILVLPLNFFLQRQRPEDIGLRPDGDAPRTGDEARKTSPRPDNVVEVNPLLPEDTWDWFCLDNVLYHGKVLTILWDKTGKRFGKGSGLQVFADGRRIAQRDTLGRVQGPLKASH